MSTIDEGGPAGAPQGYADSNMLNAEMELQERSHCEISGDSASEDYHNEDVA